MNSQLTYLDDLEFRFKSGIFIFGFIIGVVFASLVILIYQKYTKPKMIDTHRNTVELTVSPQDSTTTF